MAMAHPRKQIRQAVVALLIAANTNAAGRVKGTRVEPHKNSQLPAISVYTLTDPVDEDLSTNTTEVHPVELEIALWVAHKDSAPADDAMDDLAEQVEAAMRATVSSNSMLGGKATAIVFKGTAMEVAEDDGRSDPEIGIAVMKYVVVYRASLAAADATDDFLRADAKHPLVGGIAGDTPVAEDLFNVRSS